MQQHQPPRRPRAWHAVVAAAVLLVLLPAAACRPRSPEEGAPGQPAASRPACPPLDAVYVPLTEARADILQRSPTDAPERWRELAAVDRAAARALSQASLPPELPAPDRSRLEAVLVEMEQISDELAGLYDARAQTNAAQDALRERIDAHSAAIQARCTPPGAQGCRWSGSPPSEPAGQDAPSLLAFVEKGRTLSALDPGLDAEWQALLGALTERAEALRADEAREAAIQGAFGRLQALDTEEAALLSALAAACPEGLPAVEFTAEIPRAASGGLPALPAEGGAATPPPAGSQGGLPPRPEGAAAGELPPLPPEEPPP